MKIYCEGGVQRARSEVGATGSDCSMRRAVKTVEQRGGGGWNSLVVRGFVDVDWDVAMLNPAKARRKGSEGVRS